MAVTRSNVGTTAHLSTGSTVASPQTISTASVTVSVGDTALIVALSYGAQQGSVNIVAAVKADPAGANVTVPQVAGCRVIGSGGVDQDGWTDYFVLLDPVTALGSSGSKAIGVTLSGWTGNVQVDTCVTPSTVTGAIGTVTGGHATSTNLQSSITSGSLTVGTGGYGQAVAANGTAAPTVTAGTLVASITGSVNTGSDNTAVADITANGPITFATNAGDEEQLSYIIITAAAGAVPNQVVPQRPETRGVQYARSSGLLDRVPARIFPQSAFVAVSGTANAQAALVGVTASNATPPSPFVTSVSGNSRYLLDQFSAPIFVQGVSPQNGIANWTLANWSTFFVDVKGKAFNAAQIHAVFNFQADAETSTAPFGSNSTLSPQNANYWATLDSIITSAATNGITVFLTLVDNITCGSTIASAADSDLTAYGTFLGNRYKASPNIVWVVGNDFDPSQWTARNPKYKKITDAIIAAGDTHLICVWNNTVDGNANTFWNGIAKVDTGYAYDTPPYYRSDVEFDGSLAVTMPHLWFEGTYFGEHNAVGGSSSNLELRKLAWWEITWGGVGHFFGTHETWGGTVFSTWVTEFSTAATIYNHLALVPAAFARSGWQSLAPDRSHVFQTGGRGTFKGGASPALDTDTFSTSSFINAGTLAITYFPTSRGSITFDTTKLSGTVTALWLDPTTGSTTSEPSPAAPTYPGNNAAGDPDWVLIHQGTAAVTATAQAALVTVIASNPVGTGTGTANAQAALVTVTASNPVATGTALATAQVASVTVTASNPVGTGTGRATATAALVTVTASNALATNAETATAQAALVAVTATNPGTATAETATAQVALVTVTASNPAGRGTGTASATVALVNVTASNPTGTGTATASPVVALVNVTATNPSASGAAAGTAPAQVALVNVTALNPAGSGSSIVAAAVALVSVSAANPALSTAETAAAVVALVGVSATNPSASGSAGATASPGAATVVVAALPPALSSTAHAAAQAALVAVLAFDAAAFTLRAVFWGRRRSVRVDLPRTSVRVDENRYGRPVDP